MVTQAADITEAPVAAVRMFLTTLQAEMELPAKGTMVVLQAALPMAGPVVAENPALVQEIHLVKTAVTVVQAQSGLPGLSITMPVVVEAVLALMAVLLVREE